MKPESESEGQKHIGEWIFDTSMDVLHTIAKSKANSLNSCREGFRRAVRTIKCNLSHRCNDIGGCI